MPDPTTPDDPAPTLLAVTWLFDTTTREHVAVITEGTEQVEVDRLPAHTAAGGPGSVGPRVAAAEDAVDTLILDTLMGGM